MKGKKFIAVVSAVAACVLALCMFVSCDKKIATLEISQTQATILIGETITLTATYSDGSEAEWETSDASVATVKKGTVRGVKAGKVIVTAKSGEATASCEIKVKGVEVTVSESSITVEKGKTHALTATASDGGKTTWKSSDETVAIVSDTGVVTGVAEGDAIITVSRGAAGSATCAVQVRWSDKPTDYYDIANGDEASSVTANSDKFVEWHDQGWVGSNVVISEAWYGNGAAHFSFSGNTAQWYGFQIFYKNTANVVGQKYKITLKINAEKAGGITVNGTVVSLQVGDNAVEVYYTETELNSQQTAAASLSVQAGVNGGDIMTENTLVLSDLKFEAFDSQKLSVPTRITVATDKTVMITHANGDKSTAFEISFIQNGQVKAIQTLKNGEKIDDSTLQDGEYGLAVAAVGAGIYENSDRSAILAQYTVANGGVSYNLFSGGETDAAANAGKWYYWTEFNGISDAKYENGAVRFTIDNGGNWYSNQIFYKDTALTENVAYTLKCTINSTVAESITLNGTTIELKVGANDVSVEYTQGSGASFSLQGGVNGGTAFGAGTFTITDVRFVAKT